MSFNVTSYTYALKQAVAYTFANLAFVHIEDYKKVNLIKKLGNLDSVAVIDLYAPFQGSIGLVIENKLSDDILSLFDDQDKDNPDNINAILAEITNTIAGQFMAPLVKEKQQFEFGLPRFSSINKENSELVINKQSIILEFLTEERKIYCFYLPYQNDKEPAKSLN